MSTLIDRFAVYYSTLGSSGSIPDFVDFNIADVPSDIARSLVLLKYDPGQDDYIYAVVGVAVVAAFGADFSGASAKDIGLGARYDAPTRRGKQAGPAPDILPGTPPEKQIQSFKTTHGRSCTLCYGAFPFLSAEGTVDRVVLVIDPMDQTGA